MNEQIAATLEEGGYQANTEAKYIYGATYEFKQIGRVLQAKAAQPSFAGMQFSIDESLVERLWMINSQFPERAFNLTVAAFEREQRLFFLQIEGSESGIYLKAQSFLDAYHATGFDELRVQLPVAPILAMKNGEIAAMILEYSETPTNFVEAAEAFSFGKWEKLDNLQKRSKSAVISG